MKNRKKPYLGGIQEFRVAAYVKDLKAGKLDPQAKMGRFVGYNSESKRYQIYWPQKCSVTVERNVVFDRSNTKATENPDTSYSDVLAEGENDKVIQPSPDSTKNTENTKNPDKKIKQQPAETNTDNTNSVPFPATKSSQNIESISEAPDNNDKSQKYRCSHHSRKAPGAYKTINDGLTAALAQIEDLEVEDPSAKIMEEDVFDLLPLDFALIGGLDAEPASIDEALHGPEVKEWGEVLQYEISQLEKLKTWSIKNPPPEHKAITSNEVLRYK